MTDPTPLMVLSFLLVWAGGMRSAHSRLPVTLALATAGVMVALVGGAGQ